MSKSYPFLPAITVVLMFLAGCTDFTATDSGPLRAAPPGAAPGTCWERHVSPAVIETVTIQIMVKPERRDTSGQIIQPAIFRTETRQDIIRPRSESWLQTTCLVDMTPDFIASLQRALAVRGHYNGTITGEMDRQTRQAILRYQRRDGLESQTLSLDSARHLGLIAVPK